MNMIKMERYTKLFMTSFFLYGVMEGVANLNSFNKIIGIFVAVVLMFIFPLMYNAQKQDMISQVYVSNETTEFINNIKNKGYITKNMYHSYVSKINGTGNLYNIEIIHSHKKIEPLYEEDTGEFINDYTIYYYNTYQDEIYEVIDQEETYHFSQGDFISIKVNNKNKTLATTLMQVVYKSIIPTEQIIVTYGGLIRDEAD